MICPTTLWASSATREITGWACRRSASTSFASMGVSNAAALTPYTAAQSFSSSVRIRMGLLMVQRITRLERMPGKELGGGDSATAFELKFKDAQGMLAAGDHNAEFSAFENAARRLKSTFL